MAEIDGRIIERLASHAATPPSHDTHTPLFETTSLCSSCRTGKAGSLIILVIEYKENATKKKGHNIITCSGNSRAVYQPSRTPHQHQPLSPTERPGREATHLRRTLSWTAAAGLEWTMKWMAAWYTHASHAMHGLIRGWIQRQSRHANQRNWHGDRRHARIERIMWDKQDRSRPLYCHSLTPPGRPSRRPLTTWEEEGDKKEKEGRGEREGTRRPVSCIDDRDKQGTDAERKGYASTWSVCCKMLNDAYCCWKEKEEKRR